MKLSQILTQEYLYEEFIIKKRKMFDIANEHECSVATISNYIARFNIKPKTSDKYIGKQFGKLVVIKDSGKKQNSHIIFECECECGNIINVQSYSLVTGNTTSCGCSARKRGKDHPNYTGYEEISHSIWLTLQYGAKSRNLPFDITIEYAWDLFIKQDRKCAISGVPLIFGRTRKTMSATTASLDRIDSSQGYIHNNVWWVHKNVNVMKWDFSLDEFIDWCHRITLNNSRFINAN
jgi:hypothetical protein